MHWFSLLIWIVVAAGPIVPARCDGPAPPRAGAPSVRPILASARAPLSLRVSAPTHSLARRFAWRYRLKSVLEGSQPDVFQSADLGPIATPEPGSEWRWLARCLIHTPALRPLRC